MVSADASGSETVAVGVTRVIEEDGDTGHPVWRLSIAHVAAASGIGRTSAVLNRQTVDPSLALIAKQS